MLGVSAWHLRKSQKAGDAPTRCSRASAKLALIVGVVAVVATMFFGDNQARLMETAAADEDGRRRGAVQHAERGQLLPADHRQPVRRPHLPDPHPPRPVGAGRPTAGTARSRASTRSRPRRRRPTATGSYVPVLWVTYWTFRIMVGCGIAHVPRPGLGPVAACTGARSTPRSGSCAWPSPRSLLPFVANATGWIFTEMGRQPWVVYGLLKTAQGVSPVGHRVRGHHPGRIHRHLLAAGHHRLRADGPLRPVRPRRWPTSTASTATTRRRCTTNTRRPRRCRRRPGSGPHLLSDRENRRCH